MMYYAYNKDGDRMPGYTDSKYNGSYGSCIETAAMHCGEGGHVGDENGHTVWAWGDWAKED